MPRALDRHVRPIVIAGFLCLSAAPPRSACRDFAVLSTKSRPDLARSSLTRDQAKLIVDGVDADGRLIESLVLHVGLGPAERFGRAICLERDCTNQLLYLRRNAGGLRAFIAVTGRLDTFVAGKDAMTAWLSDTKLVEYDVKRHTFVPNGTCLFVDALKLSVPAKR
ncbi:MAG: hypothetical protein JNK82_38850 [Myxococcaceae bacterium]|nr:hypothetical protein [Myxococcaceae bacterium]